MIKLDYWQKRMLDMQNNLTDKSIEEVDSQLKRYYKSSMNRVISSFENTYNKILLQIEQGKEPSPALLYQLDKYWEMQSQLKAELQKLGDKQAELLSREFEKHFFQIYNSTSLPSDKRFNTISKEDVCQMIKQVWCADGKTWSDRIWKNTDILAETLNKELVNCVAVGQKTTYLKNMLQKRFNVAYSNADTLVRTELAHIQTQAAQQRYKDYGIEEVEAFVDEDERTCSICKKHEGERYSINSQIPIPYHPRCRCCIIPVVRQEEK